MELLDESSDDHASGCPGDASLAVEDDWSGGSGVLQQGDDLVEAVWSWGRVLVQGNAKGFDFVVLRKGFIRNFKIPVHKSFCYLFLKRSEDLSQCINIL